MNKFALSLVMASALAACQTAPSATTPAAPPAGGKTAAGTPATAASTTAWRAPRGPDGVHPDLNGVWKAGNVANFNIEAHAAQSALQLRPGPYVPVPDARVVAMGAVGSVPAGIGIVQGDGVIPYKPEAKKQRDENRADWINRDPEIKCYLPGVPRANYMPYPFQIFQSKSQIFIAYEYAGAVRNIFMNKEPPPVDDRFNDWMGSSYGKWDGDTLVVKAVGFNDGTWFDRAGNHHSTSLEVTERWTPAAPGVMRYEAEIKDEDTFTKPWKIAFNLYQLKGEDAQLQQFKCVEFVEELMYGHLRKSPLPGPALEKSRQKTDE